MPDNHFENKAKQKLEGLHFPPSEAVWLQVRAQIKKDKNRRRLILWIPLACLLLGTGAWFLLSDKAAAPRSGGVHAIAEKEKNKQAPSGSESGIKETGSSAAQDSLLEATNPEKIKAGGNLATGGLPPVNLLTAKNTNRLFENKKSAAKKMRGYPAHGDAAAAGSHALTRRAPENASAQAALTLQDPYAAGAGAAGDDSQSVQAQQKIDSANTAPGNLAGLIRADSGASHKTALADSDPEDSLKPKALRKPESRRKNKLQWGITGAGGFASHTDKSANNPSFAANNSGGLPGAYSSPASSRKSGSFYFGLRIQKPLNKTTRLFTGLQYAYSSVRISRGEKLNQPLAISTGNQNFTSVNNYYSVPVNGEYNYHNRYHFLEIPLGVEKQLGTGSRFSLNVGFSVGWLMSASALQYDPQNSIYFKHDAYFNRTQWNVLGGFQYRLLQKPLYSLQIGPQLQYGLTSLLNGNSPYTEHPFFGGIQLLLIRNRK